MTVTPTYVKNIVVYFSIYYRNFTCIPNGFEPYQSKCQSLSYLQLIILQNTITDCSNYYNMLQYTIAKTKVYYSIFSCGHVWRYRNNLK